MSLLEHQKCNSGFLVHVQEGKGKWENSRAGLGHGNECLKLSNDWSAARRWRWAMANQIVGGDKPSGAEVARREEQSWENF